MYRLTANDETTIVNGLREAAEVYDKCAAADPEFREQFEKQAKDARELADTIEAQGIAED